MLGIALSWTCAPLARADSCVTPPAKIDPRGLAETFSTVSGVADTARGQEALQSAVASNEAIVNAAAEDQATLAQSYRGLSAQALGENLQRAQQALGDAAHLFETGKSASIAPGDKARFRNFYLNARDKAQLGLDALREDEAAGSALKDPLPLKGLLGADESHPLSRSAGLSEVFSQRMPGAQATSVDALVDRLVLFNGLPEEERARIFSRLRLVAQPRLTLPDGSARTIVILHNGQAPGAASPRECGAYVSRAVPSEARKSGFTTLDLREMWRLRRKVPSRDPSAAGPATQYPKARGELVKRASEAYIAVDPYAGEPLLPGDLIVKRTHRGPAGAVLVVRSFDAETMRLDAMESLGGHGALRDRQISLAADPAAPAGKRKLLPDLFVLRLKGDDNGACTFSGGGKGGSR